ncbi:MAG TPA: hypothetical protein VLK65_08870 [Vicinamibacteria bacterium]|nr:hypothetical protein [Vicinamibacteria bacterium]
MEPALRPGRFVRQGESFAFVKGLERLAGQIDPLVSSEPERAANLYEALLVGCYAKAEEVDDSGGSFGDFMQRLCCRWVLARQSGSRPPEETARILVRWIDTDEFGYTSDLDDDIVGVLDEKGLAAFVRLSRARFEEASKEAGRRMGKIGREASYRKWAGVLRACYQAQNDAFSYIRLCKETGARGKDCLAISNMFEVHGDTRQALLWVQRGLQIELTSSRHDVSVYDLKDRERALLMVLGHPEEALARAWRDFEVRPHSFTYGELMRYVPDAERREWHERAMGRARRGDLTSSVELYLETRETERLIEHVTGVTEDALREVRPKVLRKAAERLQRDHAGVSARLYAALAMRIVGERNSKYYPLALSHLKKAKLCYEKAGLTPGWVALVEEVRSRHYRKSSFMPDFERILKNEPSSGDTAIRLRVKRRGMSRSAE